ncbi:hypothetical protein TW95_gp1249 [Pandoravirus inopinatum]|uniref:Uncharacterized protein n=1 Tax=Pandoravirus inopinatum TaxID=1605721 RepID=A0A0B5IYM0_9VIRU|nr:hypothetical protein TW95_gp1249 [Pandoravirus inopinatum]AJF97983.1 hypothetical protein [Pandoravirus inopinatum]
MSTLTRCLFSCFLPTFEAGGKGPSQITQCTIHDAPLFYPPAAPRQEKGRRKSVRFAITTKTMAAHRCGFFYPLVGPVHAAKEICPIFPRPPNGRRDHAELPGLLCQHKKGSLVGTRRAFWSAFFF